MIPSISRAAGAIRPGVFSELQRHIDAVAARGGDLIPLQIGDTCLEPPTPPASDLALSSYGATMGLAELRSAIVESITARGFAFSPLDPALHVHVGVGATHALFCAARSILNEGDHVLLAAPYWPLAHGILSMCGAVPVEVPLTQVLYEAPETNAGDLFRHALTDGTRAIYLITPNNPDGKVLSRTHLEQIAAFACEKNLWVIADEVYADYTFDRAHISIASLPGMKERTVSAYSFSKSHALAGARVGFIVAPEAVIMAARRVSTHTVFNVPVAMQRAALSALRSGDAWVATARDEYRAARDAAMQAMEGSGVKVHRPEGGTYLFLDFSPILMGAPLSDLLKGAVEAGVLLAPGEAFGKSTASFARLCVTSVPRPRMLEGIARLRKAIDAFRPSSTR
ncbi:MAG: pyridoxal phosphate-dependent aminotransferase [Polyangiaceae bacterium]